MPTSRDPALERDGRAPADRWSMEVDAAEQRPLRQQVLFIYGTGLAIGLHLALIHLYLWRSVGAFFFFLAATLVFSTATLVLWQFVLPRLAHRPVVSRFAWQLIIAALTFGVLSFLGTEVNALLFGHHSLLRPYDGGDVTIIIPSAALRRAPVIYSLIPIIPSAVLCVIAFNLHWWRIFVLQGRERELRELAVSAQLAALRAQVNPHFFFNSLNSIAQLIATEPAKAEACVERLAEIFRYLLRRTEAEFVPLAEELEIAEAYLDIERARFGDDLVVQEEIDEGARRLLLPGLTLQPLVENAVRHGISQKIGGGCVLIRAAVHDGTLQLTVRDTGAGICGGRVVFDYGVGLRNVRDRLVKLYGPEYAPTITTAEGKGTTVMLRIPVAATPAQSRAA
ncbi:MAG: sensor histidine kinase [Candidatus Binatia bacterium]